MDESEKRKQRLQAMRIGAAAQATPLESPNLSSGSTHQLVNPLADPTFSNAARSPSTPRFDYYTDPMSAFSGNKRSGSAAAANSNLPNKFPSPAYDTSRGLIPSPCSGQRSANMTPFPVPANQFQVNNSPHHGSFGMQSSTPQSFGMQSSTPQSFGMQSSGPHHGSFGMQSSAPHHGSFGMQSVPYPVLQANPASGTSTPLSSHSYSLSSIGGNNGPPNLPTSPGFRSPSSGSRGGFQSSGSQHGGSWSAGRGSRGRGYNSRFGNSPGRSGWSSSGRKGGREPLSASSNPEMYYSRQMMEDPWDQLIPVVGNLSFPLVVEKTPDSFKSWLPGSITNRDARGETVKSSRPQPRGSSLAEYLAQSFEEAANDSET